MVLLLHPKEPHPPAQPVLLVRARRLRPACNLLSQHLYHQELKGP